MSEAGNTSHTSIDKGLVFPASGITAVGVLRSRQSNGLLRLSVRLRASVPPCEPVSSVPSLPPLPLLDGNNILD